VPNDGKTILVRSRDVEKMGGTMSGVWLWCLSKMARRRDQQEVILGRGKKMVDVQAGQFVFQQSMAPAELGLPGREAARYIARLRELGKVHWTVVCGPGGAKQYTLVTIDNYARYVPHKAASLPSQPVELPEVPESLRTAAFLAKWLEWLHYRAHEQKAKAPVTPTAARRQFAVLVPLGVEKAIKALDFNMTRGYRWWVPDDIEEIEGGGAHGQAASSGSRQQAKGNEGGFGGETTGGEGDGEGPRRFGKGRSISAYGD